MGILRMDSWTRAIVCEAKVVMNGVECGASMLETTVSGTVGPKKPKNIKLFSMKNRQFFIGRD
ncbi:hypothetical protein PAECIP111893_02175 [Paenibacillus plantiphilus]|uniref:Uncharacterized protein n=1 Tax=Paenibacillus plantiphilus TaxID=2905650 RepID=A0ABN8GDJ0_9BACL|nr:hypothetical protein [Paenibacillus plantiphilus]CAH1204176.1 hypothetical protein PAECIP111893_02175 [Paenibacillus plantiphilus]